jgi:pyruvate-ferredoxin/flavodoxin oxidoreductase
VAQGKNPFQLDSRPPTLALKNFAYNETRYTMLAKSHPEAARKLLEAAQEDVTNRWRLYDYWAHMPVGVGQAPSPGKVEQAPQPANMGRALSPANKNGGETK